MSAAIRTGAYDQTSAQAAASSRPQVQSRRMSLKLGPLGLTYATDELLWPPSPPSGSMGVSPRSGFIDEQPTATSATPSATETASEGSYTSAAPDFRQELLAAQRLQEEAQREAAGQTYGPGRAERKASAPSAGASQTAAPASAMRRAIAAYLSCAAGAPAGMLSAVA